MTSSENAPKSKLTAADIMGWLRENPDFLKKNPDAIDLLHPPKKGEQDTVDFQAYMVQRLRTDREEILQSAHEIVESSRANMSNLARIHHASLMLLEAQNFEDFIRCLTMDCPSILNVDIMALAIESDSDIVPHIPITGVRALAGGSVDFLLPDKKVRLDSNIIGEELIYGGGAGLVKSQALVRLDVAQDTPPALLAFGSRDPVLFRSGQGTELIGFFSGIVERQLFSWLARP